MLTSAPRVSVNPTFTGPGRTFTAAKGRKFAAANGEIILSHTETKVLNRKDFFKIAVELEQMRASLMAAGDASKLARILSDDLYYAHSSGTHEGKEDYIDKYRRGVFVYYEFRTLVESVVPLGPNALQLNGTVRLDVAISGVLKRMDSIYLAVWRRESNIWRLLGHQTTLLSSPQ